MNCTGREISHAWAFFLQFGWGGKGRWWWLFSIACINYLKSHCEMAFVNRVLSTHCYPQSLVVGKNETNYM